MSLAIALYVFLVALFPKRIVDDEGEPYLTRYYLLRSPWLNVYLHRIHQADKDRHLHNHPWDWAWARILWAGYREERRYDMSYLYRKGETNNLTGDVYHRIVEVLPNTWTLFVCGPYTRRWGFLVNGKHIDSEEYLT